ncbi:MAG: type I-E CRISPR-associated endoribonuclease Cas2e [Sphaerochaeta sp.]
MVVVVANDLPPAVRGRMKLYFVEPKPSVFVSGINDSVANKVVDYLFEAGGCRSGILVFQSIPYPPGFKIRSRGITDKTLIEYTGLQLVMDLFKPIG